MYIVIKKGLYMQDILGIYDERERAVCIARNAAKKDTDDYHSYEIYEVPHNLKMTMPNTPIKWYRKYENDERGFIVSTDKRNA